MLLSPKFIVLILILLLILPLVVVIHVALICGELINRWRHPNDADLYDRAIKEVRRAPERFPVKSTSRLQIDDGVFRLDDNGSLYVHGTHIITSMRQSMKIKKIVRRLWENQKNTDPAQEELPRDIPS